MGHFVKSHSWWVLELFYHKPLPYMKHRVSYLSAVRANMTGMSHIWQGYFGGSFLSFLSLSWFVTLYVQIKFKKNPHSSLNSNLPKIIENEPYPKILVFLLRQLSSLDGGARGGFYSDVSGSFHSWTSCGSLHTRMYHCPEWLIEKIKLKMKSTLWRCSCRSLWEIESKMIPQNEQR